MTIQPSDAPDWSGIPGGLRYLGALTLTGNGQQDGTLAFTPATYDGAVYIVLDQSADGAAALNSIFVLNTDTGTATLIAELRNNDPPLTAFVARVMGASWEVRAEVFLSVVGPAETWRAHVFAVPAFPLAVIQQPTNPLNVDIAEQSWSGLRVGPREGYVQYAHHRPAAATRATATFIGIPDFAWCLDLAEWTIRNNAAAANQVGYNVKDGGVAIWSGVIVIPAIVNSSDRVTLGPQLGIRAAIGNDLTIDFDIAGPAGTFEEVQGAAYLVEG